MFTWAVISPDYSVRRIERATLDVPKTRPDEHWVRVQDGAKWRQSLVYNPLTKRVE